MHAENVFKTRQLIPHDFDIFSNFFYPRNNIAIGRKRIKYHLLFEKPKPIIEQDEGIH